jgi:hypothetical protein
MSMNIEIEGVSAQKCYTGIAEYVIFFYPRDHSRQDVNSEIKQNGYTIVKEEYQEGGELLSWYVSGN